MDFLLSDQSIHWVNNVLEIMLMFNLFSFLTFWFVSLRQHLNGLYIRYSNMSLIPYTHAEPGKGLCLSCRPSPRFHQRITEVVAKRWQPVTLLRTSDVGSLELNFSGISSLHTSFCARAHAKDEGNALLVTDSPKPWQLLPLSRPPRITWAARRGPGLHGTADGAAARAGTWNSTLSWRRPVISSRYATSRTRASSPDGTCRWGCWCKCKEV